MLVPVIAETLDEALRYHRHGDLATATSMYRQILRVDPQHAETLNHLACLRYRQGELGEAASLFKRALEADPQRVETWLNLGSAFVASRQLIEAEKCFRSVTDLDADNTDGWLNLSNILKVQHRVEDAAAAFRQASRRLPPQPLSDLWTATLCSPVFPDNAAIDAYRDQLQTEIIRLTEQPITIDSSDIGALASPPPLNLPFHGRNDRKLLEAYAGIFQHSFPQERPARRTGRPQVGFVVTSGHEAIFLRFLGAVLNRLDSAEFQPVVVCAETGVAFLKQGLDDAKVGLLPLPYDFSSAVERARAARFDVLYHWETGTDVTNYFLPFCRLAPIQCASMGNPETSGIPAIDYFISSRLYEPHNGSEHYTEELVLLDGIGSFQSQATLPTSIRSRESFGLSANHRLYVCAQKLQKLHPDFDAILADILRRDPRGVVVLVADEFQTAAQRLHRRFESVMPDVAGRVLFAPRLEFPDYLSLLVAADVLLDPIHYGGGLTMHDALSLNRPVVTLPGEFARGRYAAGLYEKMEVTTLVADSPQHYAALAVQLANEPDLRQSIETTLRECSSQLFEDTTVVAQYQALFERLVTQARDM